MPPPTSLCTVLRRAQRQKRGPVESKRAFHPKNKIDLQSHVGFSLQWRSTMGESSTMDRRCDCPWLSEGGRCEGLYRLPNPCRLGRMGRKGPQSLLSRTTGAASVFCGEADGADYTQQNERHGRHFMAPVDLDLALTRQKICQGRHNV
jgi:hypothetical protein